MCNIYRISPRRGTDKDVHSRIAAAVGNIPSSLVRKSDPGIVVLAEERVEIMRWGFQRSFNPAINNARSDKLESGMWAEAFRARRCVIPVSLFYEWGPGIGGRKQAYEFHDPEDDYLWIAGIWEENPEVGPCYSMVTTATSPIMAPIHDRMPTVLRPDEVRGFLDPGIHRDFHPFAGSLVVTPCASPLVKPKKSASQQELF